MTQGFFYMPVGKPNSYLVCKAANDGDIEGLGFALLGSSHVMPSIMKTNYAFAGVMSYFDQESNKIAGYHDYMIEFFDNCEDEEIRQSGVFTIELLDKGDIEEAQKTYWWNLPLDEKIKALGFSKSSGVGLIERKEFVFTDENQIKKLYQVLFDTHTDYELLTSNYVWHDDQLYQGIEDKANPERHIYVPIISLVFLQLNSWAGPFYLTGSYSDMEHYFNHHITQKDIATLLALVEYNKKEQLFNVCPLLQPLIDKTELENGLSLPGQSAHTMKI